MLTRATISLLVATISLVRSFDLKISPENCHVVAPNTEVVIKVDFDEEGLCVELRHEIANEAWFYDVPPPPSARVHTVVTLCPGVNDSYVPNPFYGFHEAVAMPLHPRIPDVIPWDTEAEKQSVTWYVKPQDGKECLARVASNSARKQEMENEKTSSLRDEQKRSSDAFRHVAIYPELFQFASNDSNYDPLFLQAEQTGAYDEIVKRVAPTVWAFPLFTKEFCAQFVAELDNFWDSGINASRPNSMNRYGVVLDEIGYYPTLQHLVEKRLRPLLRGMLHHWGGGTIDEHHGFVVRYKMGEDLNLSRHMDESEITLNVNLGKIFTGGDVFFLGERTVKPNVVAEEEVRYRFEEPGMAIIHAGQQFHGAHTLESGERLNLIVWGRSVKDYRSSAAEHFIAQCPKWLSGDYEHVIRHTEL